MRKNPHAPKEEHVVPGQVVHVPGVLQHHLGEGLGRRACGRVWAERGGTPDGERRAERRGEQHKHQRRASCGRIATASR